jgi:hypothetical protein
MLVAYIVCSSDAQSHKQQVQKTVTTAVLPYIIMQDMLDIQNTKNQVLSTWLLSAGYSLTTTIPEQGFGS